MPWNPACHCSYCSFTRPEWPRTRAAMDRDFLIVWRTLWKVMQPCRTLRAQVPLRKDLHEIRIACDRDWTGNVEASPYVSTRTVWKALHSLWAFCHRCLLQRRVDHFSYSLGPPPATSVQSSRLHQHSCAHPNRSLPQQRLQIPFSWSNWTRSSLQHVFDCFV